MEILSPDTYKRFRFFGIFEFILQKMDIETTSLITTSTTPKKVHKKKAAKLQILKTLTESNVNMYGIPKKLIIFDLNHVLIFRPKKFSEKFILRPHAKQFLHEIAQRYIRI